MKTIWNTNNSALRRKNLIDQMSSQESLGISCQGCSGLCCTFRKNSMMMTPSESLELYRYLKSSNLWTDKLKTKLKDCIKEFRLDYDLSTTRNLNFRRTYTCPFFKHMDLGCPLPLEVKPYGCLAFNPQTTCSKEGEGCVSDTQLLEQREKLDALEIKVNQNLKETLDISWEKRPIPSALLAIDLAWEQYDSH